MSPSAMPMEGTTTPTTSHATGTTTTSELVQNGMKSTLSKTAPSLIPTNTNTSALAELDASLLTESLTTSPREVPALDSPAYTESKTCTDHMITASWTASSGWAAPELKPYGPLSLMPTASCLHYATECFEGMKLYRGHDGALRLFRPSLNCNRMLMSSLRIALPGFSPLELEKLILALCARDGAKWLPKSRPGQFLYIRPTMIANDSSLGVQKPKEALLYILFCCFPTLDTRPGGMHLLASQNDMVRAWPGGFGYAKVGANYGPSLVAQGRAREQGFDQILWLLGEESMVTEAGASNFFVVLRTREGKRQLWTAPLDDKIILDGITRRSILQIARERLSVSSTSSPSTSNADPLDVVEKKFTMQDVKEAFDENRLLEAFTAGTAFFVSPVSRISWQGQDITMGTPDDGVASAVKGWLRGIMYGKERHEWGVVVDEIEN